MSSAAVIGRQLRQQQTTPRVPGPVVPPTHYRGRSNVNNSHNDQIQIAILANCSDYLSNNNNYYHSNDQGADADSKFAKFSQQFNQNSFEFYPHPAHREAHNKHKNKHAKKKCKANVDVNTTDDDNGNDQNRLVCTKHCFCVAFKALSTGVILLVVGTIMSIVGFFADSLASEMLLLNNGTLVMNVNKSTKTHLHNMTYVGPVIMGLGFIVIVAACVLTFEVRDTLGIKDDPKNKTKSANRNNGNTNGNATNSNCVVNISDHSDKQSIKDRPNISSSTAVMTPKYSSSSNRDRLSMNNCSYNKHDTNQSELLSCSYSHYMTDCYCRIPSPVDIELSDPDGCSTSINTITHYSSSSVTTPLSINDRWRKRCSCSGSPSHSMLVTLNNINCLSTTTSPSSNDDFNNRHQNKSTLKMIASIDDLTSFNSYQSNDDASVKVNSTLLMPPKTSQMNHNSWQQKHNTHGNDFHFKESIMNLGHNTITANSVISNSQLDDRSYPLLTVRQSYHHS